MRIVVATRSPHKVEELRRLIAAAGGLPGAQLCSLAEWEAETGRAVPEVVEDRPSFRENAEKKARAVAEATGAYALADDSGLCVDALGGAPGVHSARYSGVEGPGRDAANNRRLLEALADVPDGQRGAAFVCALCLAAPDGRTWHAEGRCRGHIGHAEDGSEGFGYDPLFISEEPEARGRSHGRLSPEAKDAVSHRGRALRALLPTLRQLVANGERII
ncbi:MAG: non-canonical purine NTP pyrophosphatase [Deltaproteobacteria bacterium]|nr:MAG: non-canonical purine NTP pyrophosphatase [Deltaproteobacteria bacterium]